MIRLSGAAKGESTRAHGNLRDELSGPQPSQRIVLDFCIVCCNALSRCVSFHLESFLLSCSERRFTKQQTCSYDSQSSSQHSTGNQR